MFSNEIVALLPDLLCEYCVFLRIYGE
ncbi:uncharacterized protein METZ01_LOCUS7600 [marine metagenome]|uniref:Uncharacterized protein n=1 Tax=marine metagenome TaxID=408172 RepID=A0A381NJG5_9ZZZZ